tara:strand:- start:1430 stop:2038 length:609 start_codon:yes stop_codon:yes gene_type:complete
MSYKSVSNFNYKNEILRKLIHLFDSVIPLSLFYISRENLLFILTPITIIFIILDFARHHISYLGKIYSTFFNIVTREIEQKRNNVTGASYYLLGCLIVVYFFQDINIIISSLLIMSISDSFAALIGVKYGKTKIYGKKSLEGSFSFFVSTIIILYIFMSNLSPFEYIYISLLITLVELFSFHRINDNLTIPVFAALALNYIV